jgi:hypothetical protein
LSWIQQKEFDRGLCFDFSHRKLPARDLFDRMVVFGFLFPDFPALSPGTSEIIFFMKKIL